MKQRVPVLLDSENQRIYISNNITDKLKLTPVDKNFLKIHRFGPQKQNALNHICGRDNDTEE